MGKEIFVGRMQVLVIRKNIKNMYLRVCPPEGDVRVTAPFRYTDAQIAVFVQAKVDWIRKQQRLHKLQSVPVGSVDFGGLCCLSPISAVFGKDMVILQSTDTSAA